MWFSPWIYKTKETMPHYGNLENTHNRTELTIEWMKGWKTPIVIEMGSVEDNGTINTHWRVKGTAHMFTIPTMQLNRYESHLDHFRMALETFRDDYMQWHEDDFSEKWMREYHYIFGNFIVT